MIRRGSIGLVFAVVFLMMQGVAHSVPIESSAQEQNSPESLLYADLDDDQLITGQDFLIFRHCYLKGGPECGRADFDGDQAIDLVDFGYLASAFRGDTTNVPSKTVVPEPATLLLVVAGCTLIAIAKREGRRRS